MKSDLQTLNCVRNAFGNNAAPAALAAVQAIRRQKKQHTGNFTSEERKVAPDGE